MKYRTVLLLAFLSGRAWADQGARTHFLSHGPGAAEEAMGEAVVGTVSGPSSLYYNSAGLSGGNEGISGEWTRLLPGITYSWFASSLDLKRAQVGLGIISLDLGEITARTSLIDPGLAVSSRQRAYILGSSKEIRPGLAAGATLGLLDFDLAGYRSKAYFADLGLAYKAPSLWSAGFTVKNAYFSGLDFGGEKEVYPRELRLGAALQKRGLVVSAQANQVLDGSGPRFSFGASYSVIGILTLRAGFNGDPRFGIGLATRNKLLTADFSQKMGAITGSQKVTLTYHFRRGEEDAPPKSAYDELKIRGGSLKDYLSEESKRLLQQGQDSEAKESLEKLLALDPADRDAALALKALTGRNYSTVRGLPLALSFAERARRKTYLRFSVAFAEGNAREACAVARDFTGNWPEDKRSRLMGILLSGKDCPIESTKEEKTK